MKIPFKEFITEYFGNGENFLEWLEISEDIYNLCEEGTTEADIMKMDSRDIDKLKISIEVERM